MKESNRIEYKIELTGDLEKEVIAFLNYHEGGNIYIGITNKGVPVGIQNFDLVYFFEIMAIKYCLLMFRRRQRLLHSAL